VVDRVDPEPSEPANGSGAAPITAADESFTHQAPAPFAATAYVDPRWAERCWHLLDVGDGWVLGTGRALWRHDGRRTGVAGISTGPQQWSVRTAAPFTTGDDPDRPDVGDLRIETVRPLEEVRLRLEPRDDPDSDAPGFGFDLTWRARFPPVLTHRNRIERDGQVLTDYVNYFHPGRFTGTVTAGGDERRVTDRAGFRDRGWGLRRHEGAARRGMHIFLGCELVTSSLYLLVYEDAAGRRMLTSGWLIDEGGLADRVVAAAHDLRLDGRRLLGGTVELTLASGSIRRCTFTATGRLFMEALGYTTVPGRAAPGRERLDLTDPSVVAAWEGLFDNACDFDVDGAPGHGLVEVGLGIHARYRPEAAR
jgi:hypothetical protein